MGTGTRDIVSKCVKWGLRKPEFEQAENFKVTLWRYGAEAETLETGQVTGQVKQLVAALGDKELSVAK